MAKLFQKKETLKELVSDAKQRNYLSLHFSKQLHSALGAEEDKGLKILATRFLVQQEALFRGLNLVSMLFEDLSSGPFEQSLIANYNRAVKDSSSSLLHRLRIAILKNSKCI